MSNYTPRNFKIILPSSLTHLPHPINSYSFYLLNIFGICFLFIFHSYLVCPSFLTWIITYSLNWSLCSNINIIYITPLFRIFQQFLIVKLLGMALHSINELLWSDPRKFTNLIIQGVHITPYDLAILHCLKFSKQAQLFHSPMSFLTEQELLKCSGSPGKNLYIFQDLAQPPPSPWSAFWLLL